MSELNNDNIELSLPADGYAAFDASSLKELIIERLNANNTFTDQNYEGSNLNAFIDVLGYTYHTLMFYLNQTSTESMFSESQIYENMNRIVKTLDYKPVGSQSSTLTISASGTDNLPVQTYTIPRYSYVNTGAAFFSFNRDVTFLKTQTGVELLSDLSRNALLYEGRFVEYPSYTATGAPYETLTVVPGNDVVIDHFNIHVYIQEGGIGGSIHQYNVVDSLFFEKPTARACEIRLNESKRYEIKFGNNVTGKQLNANDIVYVYYLESTGELGEIETLAAQNRSVTLFTSEQYNNITSSVNVKGTGIIYIDQSNADQIRINNNEPSTKFYSGEDVESIRENAPKTFSSQYRLVSLKDYETFINTNFSNFIVDVHAMNNTTYLETHIKYLYDLGITKPSIESRVLYNQANFSTSCNFNNIYMYCVPRLEKTTTLTTRNNYLTSSQKEIMLNRMSVTKCVTVDPIIMDPVYVAISPGLRSVNEQLNVQQSIETKILIVQDDSSRINSSDIMQKASNVLKEYFSTTQAKLGMFIDITTISNNILNIPGVSTFYTYRPDLGNNYVEGMSLYIWNPVYSDIDIMQTSQNYNLPKFKFPFLFEPGNIINKISVVRESDSMSVLRQSTNNVTETITLNNSIEPESTSLGSSNGY